MCVWSLGRGHAWPLRSRQSSPHKNQNTAAALSSVSTVSSSSTLPPGAEAVALQARCTDVDRGSHSAASDLILCGRYMFA